MTEDIISRSEELIKTFGFSQWGWTLLKKPLSIEYYKNWLKEDFQGEMEFLKTHLPLKENPKSLHKKAQSALVITKDYYPHPYSQSQLPLKNLRQALYARGTDYHYSFKGEIEELCQMLKEIFPNEQFISMTDSSPVLERDLAYQARLGWFGKNSCLIHRKQGSLFFIGEIYSTLKLKPEKEWTPLPDHCGTCQRCIDVCPTQAIESDRVVNAKKCISYLTIESKSDPPEELREKMKDWFFGCDLCQTVCPWNQKVFGKETMKNLSNDYVTQAKSETLSEIKWLLTSSNKSIEKSLYGSPLSRPGGRRLKRNAIIVATNLNLKELLPEIKSLQSTKGLEDICNWALERLDS